MRIDLGQPLEAVRAAALAEVDAAAEAARRQFLTPGAAQALEYTATEAEARAYAAAGMPAAVAAGTYPFLEAELAALQAVGVAAALGEVAASVLHQAEAWRQAGAAIKALRRAAKLRIEAAGSVAAIRAAAQVTWPAPGRRLSA